MELAQAGDNHKALRAIAAALIEKAAAGDVPSIKEIGDRLDGKPAQAIIGGDEDDPAIQTVTKIELIGVRPSASDT